MRAASAEDTVQAFPAGRGTATPRGTAAGGEAEA